LVALFLVNLMHTELAYVRRDADGKVERTWKKSSTESAPLLASFLTNGAAINLLRLRDKSRAPAGASAACDCCHGAAVLELIASRSFWREALHHLKSIASEARKLSLMSTITTVAVGVTEQFRVGAVALHFERGQHPGDIFKSVQQQLRWCSSCADERIELTTLLGGSNQHDKWRAQLDVVDTAPGTVYRDELCIQLDTVADVGKPVRYFVPDAPVAAAAAHIAESPYLLPPSNHWHKKTYG
jgi:hypothetical protein